MHFVNSDRAFLLKLFRLLKGLTNVDQGPELQCLLKVKVDLN